MVTINGKQTPAEGKTLADYLTEAGYDLKRIAVELNGNIVPKATFAQVILKEGDVVEIVSFVGGG